MRFSEMAYPFSQKGTCVFRCFLITEQEKQKVENRKFEVQLGHEHNENR